MRSRTFAFVAAAVVVTACGGTKDEPEDTPAQQAPTPTAAAAPITGKTTIVQMIGDAATSGYRYEPAAVTIKSGDGIKFESISGGPHNVSIDATTLSDAAKAPLIANMPSQDLGELSSKLIQDKEDYTISFANVPAGTYAITCTPHLASNMKMTVTVQ